MSVLGLYETDLFGHTTEPVSNGPVSSKFLFPPFTVLDAKSGEWMERKRAWLSTGIKSEVGRNAKTFNIADWIDTKGKSVPANDVSIFDPVLCEVIYRWFVQKGGQVVDPFCGGSVRGIVASMLNVNYWGCDIRDEQIQANILQAREICKNNFPIYVCGDSMEYLDQAPTADFIFSCPPYNDLEKYSDSPGDLSNMEWHTFCAAYKRIILRSLNKLRENRFACFVVGDFRDKAGFYRNFVSQTIAAFEECGARLYNEAILTTPIGTAFLRVTNQFNASRKMAKTHQNVLVFCKGDPRIATKNITECDI